MQFAKDVYIIMRRFYVYSFDCCWLEWRQDY